MGIRANKPRKGVSNPGCYLRQTRNCRGALSREHYISNKVLASLESTGDIDVTGLPWQDNNSKKVGRSSLVSKVLCEGHNHYLSPLDNEAGRLIEAISEFDSGFTKENPNDENILISGSLIERWMLKTTCGMVASRQVARGGVTLEAKIPETWISILSGAMDWPAHWGLYVGVSQGVIYHSASFWFQPNSHPETGEILVVEMALRGVVFRLLLGRIDDTSVLGVHRPRALIFEQRAIEKVLEINWPNPGYDETVLFSRVGTYEGSPPHY